MPRMRPYRRETPEFIQRAPVSFYAEREIPCSPQRLFEVFEDADAWLKWAGLKSLEWTSPPPFGVGTTRTAALGPVVVDEEFLIWDAGERLTFTFTAGSSGAIRAFVEDYQVTDLGGDRCRVRWYMGIEFGGIAKLLGPLLGRVMRRQLGQALDRLARYV